MVHGGEKGWTLHARSSDLRAQAGGGARGGSVRAHLKSLRDLQRPRALQRPERASPPAGAVHPESAQYRTPRPHPPAIAATIVISSPAVTGVAKPLRNRMSSSFR